MLCPSLRFSRRQRRRSEKPIGIRPSPLSSVCATLPSKQMQMLLSLLLVFEHKSFPPSESESSSTCNLLFLDSQYLYDVVGLSVSSYSDRDFTGSSHTSDLKIGTPMATPQGAWSYRVSAGTGQPGVSIL